MRRRIYLVRLGVQMLEIWLGPFVHWFRSPSSATNMNRNYRYTYIHVYIYIYIYMYDVSINLYTYVICDIIEFVIW